MNASVITSTDPYLGELIQVYSRACVKVTSINDPSVTEPRFQLKLPAITSRDGVSIQHAGGELPNLSYSDCQEELNGYFGSLVGDARVREEENSVIEITETTAYAPNLVMYNLPGITDKSADKKMIQDVVKYTRGRRIVPVVCHDINADFTILDSVLDTVKDAIGEEAMNDMIVAFSHVDKVSMHYLFYYI